MVNAKEMRTVFSCVTGGMVGNFPPTLLAPKIGGVPHEELKKRWSGADFRWSGAELVEVFGYFFWSGVKFGGAECSQTCP
jgi:hypothetical protein